MDYVKSLVPTLCCVCRNLSSYFRTAQSWKDYVGVDLFPLLIKQTSGGIFGTSYTRQQKCGRAFLTKEKKLNC